MEKKKLPSEQKNLEKRKSNVKSREEKREK